MITLLINIAFCIASLFMVLTWPGSVIAWIVGAAMLGLGGFNVWSLFSSLKKTGQFDESYAKHLNEMKANYTSGVVDSDQNQN